jgi:hypothetical protein
MALAMHAHSHEEAHMPEKKTLEAAASDRRQGKAASTQAGEFIREEIEHVRKGKHGARSPKQAIAIGLSKARRAGVQLPPPKRGSASTRARAARDLPEAGTPVRSGKRSRATQRSQAAEKAVRTKGAAGRSAAAKKAARTRQRKG